MNAMFLSLALISVLFTQMGGFRHYTGYRRSHTQASQSKYTNLMLRRRIWRNEQPTQNVETVYLTIYYESFCEDSRDFLTSQLMAAFELLEPYLDVRLIPYGKATTRIEDSSLYYSFNCHHGPLECYGNKLHACSLEMFPSDNTGNIFNTCLMDYDQNAMGSDDLAADNCGRLLGVDVEGIKECAKDKTGNFLLNYYGERTKMVKFKYVPHVLVNGVHNNGTQLVADICALLKHPPPECKIFMK